MCQDEVRAAARASFHSLSECRNPLESRTTVFLAEMRSRACLSDGG